MTASLPIFLGRHDWIHAVQVTSIIVQTSFAARIMRWMSKRMEEDEKRWAQERQIEDAKRRLRYEDDLAG